MLYPTHQRVGVLWGLVAFPVGVFLGLIPIISFEMNAQEMFMVIICVFIGMRGAVFGAEFPDIDSHTSIPRQKHKMIGRIFDMVGVKHRGIYSHDFFSIGLTFGIIYFLVAIIGERFIQAIAQGNSLLGTIAYISLLVFIWIMANTIVDFVLWIANTLKNRKLWARVNSKRIVISILITLPIVIFLTVIGVFDIGSIFNEVSLEQSLASGMVIVTSLKIYVIFSLVGAYSHLFADMLTKSGVSIFFIKLRPMAVVDKVRKIPLIGKVVVPLDPKTGGKWEDVVMYITTALCIPATVIAVMSILGKFS